MVIVDLPSVKVLDHEAYSPGRVVVTVVAEVYEPDQGSAVWVQTMSGSPDATQFVLWTMFVVTTAFSIGLDDAKHEYELRVDPDPLCGLEAEVQPESNVPED